MNQRLARRALVVGAGAVAATGCGSSGGDAASAGATGPGGAGFDAVKAGCDARADGPGLGYCLVDDRELRVPGAAHLPVGHVLLVNVDDNSAALLARDARGFYALSAICTHQCCLVAVCADTACATLRTNPGSCATTQSAPLAATGQAFLCPCHGSAFSANGTVLNGPARTALPALAVRLEGADVVIDLSRRAMASDRVG